MREGNESKCTFRVVGLGGRLASCLGILMDGSWLIRVVEGRRLSSLGVLVFMKKVGLALSRGVVSRWLMVMTRRQRYLLFGGLFRGGRLRGLTP